MRKIVITNYLCPGDVCVLSATIKALKEAHPEIQLDYQGLHKSLFEHNPYLEPLSVEDPDVFEFEAHYPGINESNQRPKHFIECFAEYFERELRLDIPIKSCYPDLHLSKEEQLRNPILNKIGREIPYWIIVAGGKDDFETKIWPFKNYQEVVDHFKGEILFVQVGHKDDIHEPLNGVINMVGKTSLRELVQWIYHSDGVLCPITAAMHIAAGCPQKKFGPERKPCVVLGGGREPVHWEKYPNHSYINRVGKLDCCATGGCWVSKLKDCAKITDAGNSACMEMIPTHEVTQSIWEYFHLTGVNPLTYEQSIFLNDQTIHNHSR